MFSFLRNPLIAIVLIAFGVFLIYAGHKNATEFAALESHGKTADAVVANLEWKEKSNHEDHSYTAHVQFKTEDGRDIYEQMHVSTELGRAIRNQSAPSVMTVRYLPESPSIFREASAMDPSDAQSGVGRIMLIAGFVMLALRFFIRKT